jgi:hypothetical protein
MALRRRRRTSTNKPTAAVTNPGRPAPTIGPGTVDGDTVMLIVLLALPMPMATIVYTSVTENGPKLPVFTPGKTALGDPPFVWKTSSPTRF